MLARHVHLPVQSGCDRMLKRMIRRYTAAEYLARVARAAGARPGLTLSTDIIVGFPGETDDDFEATLALVREVGFVALFGFKYTPRPHTPALKLDDDVPEDGERRAPAAPVRRSWKASSAPTSQALVGTARGGADRDPRRESPRSLHRPLRAQRAGARRRPRGLGPARQIVQAEVLEAFKHSLHAVALGAVPRRELAGDSRANSRALAAGVCMSAESSEVAAAGRSHEPSCAHAAPTAWPSRGCRRSSTPA